MSEYATKIGECEARGHRWQASISVPEIEAQVRSVDVQISAGRLREIAQEMAAQTNRMLERRPDRRICGACGIQGTTTGKRVIAAKPRTDAPTEAQ